MKPIKMLGLAALAALMAMAFVGAGSAMAESTLLCSEDAEPCPEHKIIKHVHETTVSKAKLLGAVEVECDVLFLGDVEKEGAPLEILGHFTYSNCAAGKTACTVAEIEKTDAKISVLKSGHELGAVTGAGEVNVKCGALINCTYNGKGLEGHALGPLLSSGNGEVRLEKQETNRVKGLCPATAELDILTTPLETTYIKKKSAMTCQPVDNGLYEAQASAELCEKDIVGSWELEGEGAGMKCVAKSGGLYVAQKNATECERDALYDGKWELFL